jgi:hypothetical protein
VRRFVLVDRIERFPGKAEAVVCFCKVSFHSV